MQKPIVLNATPIIYLCKVGQSTLLRQLQEEKYTTQKVIEEVIDKGKLIGAPDAFIAEQLVQQAIVKVKQPRSSAFMNLLSKIPDLHQAEIQVLALAKELNGIAIVDESIARDTARIYGIEAHGTVYLILRLLYQSKITKKKAKEAIDKMIQLGWRLTAEEYAKLIRELE